MKKSQLLELVLVRFERKLDVFVCEAIDYINNDNSKLAMILPPGRTFDPTVYQHSAELKVWIAELLDGNLTLGSWMYANYPDMQPLNGIEYHVQMRMTRIAWVKWMITYWQQKGE